MPLKWAYTQLILIRGSCVTFETSLTRHYMWLVLENCDLSTFNFEKNLLNRVVILYCKKKKKRRKKRLQNTYNTLQSIFTSTE